MQSDKSDKGDRSIGGLIRDLTYELTSLVSKEAELAKAEASEKVSQFGAGIAALAVAVVLLVVGLEELTDAATVGVGYLLPQAMVPWLAPLIVGGVIAILGLILLMKGRSNLQPLNLAPNRTTESLRKDKAVAQEQFR